MADVGYREPNQVKWYGWRPGIRGTHIIRAGRHQGLGDTDVYTISAGVTFFLTGFSYSINYSNVGSQGIIDIYDDAGLTWKRLWSMKQDATGELIGSLGLFFPIEVPAAYTFRVRSFASWVDMQACIWGWEV